MIKLVAKGQNNRKVIMLGVSKGNVARLTEGLPILVKGEDIGFPKMDISIMYGETEDSIVEDLRKAGLNVPPPEMRGY